MSTTEFTAYAEQIGVTRTKLKESGVTGPWDNEPDRVEWWHLGLPCLMVRGPLLAWCGYVGVTEGHPCFGKEYNDDVYHESEVHGGLTYSDRCQGHICHTPQAGETDNVWWLGFDCAHAYDVVPGLIEHFTNTPKDKYRNAEYVKGEVEKLAMHLACVAAKG